MGSIFLTLVCLVAEFFAGAFVADEAGFFAWLFLIASNIGALYFIWRFLEKKDVGENSVPVRVLGVIGSVEWIAGIIMMANSEKLPDSIGMPLHVILTITPYLIYANSVASDSTNRSGFALVFGTAKLASAIFYYRNLPNVPKISIVYIVIVSLMIALMLILMLPNTEKKEEELKKQEELKNQENEKTEERKKKEEKQEKKENIFSAIDANDKETLQKLLNDGADINARNSDELTPLIYAIKNEKDGIATFLIEKCADFNLSDNDGWKPIHYAARYNCENAIFVLIEKGADIYEETNDCLNSVSVALKGENKEIAKLLIEKGFDVNHVPSNGITPLAWASDDVNLMQYLIEKGAVIHKNERALLSAIQYKSKDGVSFLIEKGADVNTEIISEGCRLTPLSAAITHGMVEIVECLIEKGADVNAEIITADGGHFTPLLYAVLGGNVEIVECLIEKGADVNEKYSNKLTPLRHAVLSNQIDMVKCLIEKGADVNQKDGELSVLGLAQYKGYADIAILLMQHGALF